MLNRLSTIITRDCQLEGIQPVLVGVSGGADSIYLLDRLHRSGLTLVAAHFNHGIRPDANLDVQIVNDAAQSYGIPFILGKGDVPQYAQEHNLSIEEAARIRRYRFLFEQAANYDAQAVAVAHNADDQVETILMHLLRGSGLDGLKGMTYHMLPNPWSDSIPLVRPLLGIWRREIETYCDAHELKTVLDGTNLDTRLFRNRLRHELIPELESYIPGVRKRLWQTADLLDADSKVLEEKTTQAWTAVKARGGQGYFSFNLPVFNRQHLGLKRRLIRKAVAGLRPDARDVDYALVQRVLGFAASPTQTGQADIGLGLKVLLEGDSLYLATWEADLFVDQWPQLRCDSTLRIPGFLELMGGWVLQAEVAADVEAARREALNNSNPYQTWIDPGTRQAHLRIRGRVPGDLFKPFGMGGKTMKVSDLMINLKIPQRARDYWPLVCLGDEIAWVPGYRLAQPFRLTTETQRVVILRVRHL